MPDIERSHKPGDPCPLTGRPIPCGCCDCTADEPDYAALAMPVIEHPPITVYSCPCGWRGTDPPRYGPTFPDGPFRAPLLGERFCPNAALTLHRDHADAPLVATAYVPASAR